MILSLWFWSRKIAGRRWLVSVDGVLPVLFFLLLVILVFILPLFRSLR
jgi:hypothetical protein